MDLQQLAIEEAALKTLADAVNDRLREVKQTMQEQLSNGGVTRVDATLPDGTKVATISRSTPKTAAMVVDDKAFLEWVRNHAPSEISTRLVTEVRPAYEAALLAEMTAAGTAEIADKETGVVEEVPGVEIRPTRSSSHSIRPTTGGREAIAKAWRDGQLAHLNLLQIEAGEAS